MRIGMLLDRTFPPDPRVANEARSLTAAGHAVHLLCLRHGSRQADREEWQGIHVHRVAMPRWYYRKFSAVSLDVPLYRWSLLGPFRRMVARERIEVVHTHDLPMVAIGRAVARSRGIPLVADLHENWPAALATYGYVHRFPGRMLISPSRWARHERAILPSADRIVVVIEEARDRLIEMGIEPGKIAVVRNTVEVDEFQGFGIDPRIAERFRGRYVLCYLGGFERHRGLEMVVEAMPRLARQVPDCLLVLVGSGSTEAGLRSMAARLGVADRVVFEGWQPFQRFPSYIQAADVCLIPHVRNEHTDTTIPHKLFQTMLLGRPVLTSDCRPLRRIVEETGSGLVVPSGDAEAFAAAATRLADPAVRAPMAEAGRRAVIDRYNWGRDAATLVDTYRDLARS